MRYISQRTVQVANRTYRTTPGVPAGVESKRAPPRLLRPAGFSGIGLRSSSQGAPCRGRTAISVVRLTTTGTMVLHRGYGKMTSPSDTER
jgi:hypothetical protein